MPQVLHLPPVASAVVTILGIVLAVTRLLTASRPFWASFPAWLQKGLPAALVALGLLPTALEHATSWLDVVEAFVLAVSAWFTASRGDKRLGTPSLPTFLVLLVALCLPLQACTPAAQQTVASDVVARSTALAFNGAVVGLILLDEAEARRLDNLEHPTEVQIQASVLRVERLTRARDALAIVRRALAGELGDLDERGKLKEAVAALDLVAAELQADGVHLPADLLKALDAARVVL